MEKHKVSIVCRCYNHEQTIQEAINSVIKQSYTNWELIIIDDCSTDNSVKIIDKFQDKRIKLYKNEINLGAIANLNKGFSLCNGDYICILDGDDMFLPEKLSKQVKFLDENLDYGACFSYIRIKENPAIKKIKNFYQNLLNQPSGSREEMLRKLFFNTNFLAFPTEMFRKEYIYDFPENIIATGDYNFHINMLLKTKIKVLEEELIVYNISNSNNHLSQLMTSLSNKIESLQLYESFLKISDIELFKKISDGYWNTYGEPSIETIPYFVARIAIDNLKEQEIGLYLLSKIFANKNYLKYILENTNMTYKNYLHIRMGNILYADKIKKYKKLFNVFFILFIIMLFLNIIQLIINFIF